MNARSSLHSTYLLFLLLASSCGLDDVDMLPAGLLGDEGKILLPAKIEVDQFCLQFGPSDDTRILRSGQALLPLPRNPVSHF